MVKKEYTHKRDNLWSLAHRYSLPEQCYMTDFDSIEYRYENGEIVIKAIIEYKMFEGKFGFRETLKKIKETKSLTSQLQVYRLAASILKCKSYFIGYIIKVNEITQRELLDKVYIYDLISYKYLGVKSFDEYKEFIIRL